jgi:nicotinamidase/pyrazinamidase
MAEISKLNLLNTIFWNVDTQVDFMEPWGKLYVQDAEKLKPVLNKITKLAKEKSVFVVSTADYHHADSQELSVNPDFKTTFPPHCMAETPGALYISETNPANPVIINWNRGQDIDELIEKIQNTREIVIRKDAFDVFAGNPFTDNILQNLNPETVVVYGVTTNVCVNDAVVGLSKRGENVLVVSDAIKELPNLPLPFEEWSRLGVKLITFNDLTNLLD